MMFFYGSHCSFRLQILYPLPSLASPLMASTHSLSYLSVSFLRHLSPRWVRLSSFTLYPSPVAVELSEGQTFIRIRPEVPHYICLCACVLKLMWAWRTLQLACRVGKGGFKHTSCIFHETLILRSTHTHTHTNGHTQLHTQYNTLRHTEVFHGKTSWIYSLALPGFCCLYHCQVVSYVCAHVFHILQSSSNGGLKHVTFDPNALFIQRGARPSMSCSGHCWPLDSKSIGLNVLNTLQLYAGWSAGMLLGSLYKTVGEGLFKNDESLEGHFRQPTPRPKVQPTTRNCTFRTSIYIQIHCLDHQTSTLTIIFEEAELLLQAL